MSITQNILTKVSEGLRSLYAIELDPEQLALQPTRKEFDGSFTLVVFPFLKVSKKGPEQTAAEIGEYLKIHCAEVAGYNVVKGFLNLEVDQRVWIDLLHQELASDNFGHFPANGQKVMVEFSSPNTNKPLHLGHLRNNFLGDSVSKILEASGHEVNKVNLVNDRGIHICKSMLAYQKFGDHETPESAGIKGDHLIGKYYVKFDQEYKAEIAVLVQKGMVPDKAKKEAPLILEAQKMLKQWEDGDEEVVSLWKKMNGWVYDGFNQSYETMGVSFDKVYYESNTYLLGKDIIEEGLEKNIFFKKEDQSVWIDLTSEKLDEKLVLRGDGTSVYITQDMGTCDHKYEDFAFDKSVYVVGNEQDYHFKVLFKIMLKMERPYAEGLYHLSYGMVDLPSGKMKSREGTVVDADDLMQEMFDTAEKQTRELGKIDGLSDGEAKALYKTLGLGALKYFLLKVDPKKRMLFDPVESIEFQGNTGPFVQYTYARISAIIRRAKTLDVQVSFDSRKINELHMRESEVIQKLNDFPMAVQNAAKDYAPYIIAQYVYDLAKMYNSFYQDVQIFGAENEEIMAMRVIMSKVVAKTIKRCMGMLGVDVPERM